jgi:hypothetical protein
MTTNTIQRIWNDKVSLYIVISHIFSGLVKILLDEKDSTWYTRDDDLNPETYALKVKKIKKIIYLSILFKPKMSHRINETLEDGFLLQE